MNFKLSPEIEALSKKEDLLVDNKTLRYYARDADDAVTLEEVRHILSKISGSLADDIIAERG